MRFDEAGITAIARILAEELYKIQAAQNQAMMEYLKSFGDSMLSQMQEMKTAGAPSRMTPTTKKSDDEDNELSRMTKEQLIEAAKKRVRELTK